MPTLNQQQIDELWELFKKATQGQWRISYGMDHRALVLTDDETFRVRVDGRPDAEWIAAAHNAMPAILETLAEKERLATRVYGTISGGNLSVRGYHDKGDVGSEGEPWVTEEELGTRWSCCDVVFTPDKDRVEELQKFTSELYHRLDQKVENSVIVKSLRGQLVKRAGAIESLRAELQRANERIAELETAHRQRIAGVTCAWTEDDVDGSWDTSCGKKYGIVEGTPTENEMQFCTFCGKRIEEVRP